MNNSGFLQLLASRRGYDHLAGIDGGTLDNILAPYIPGAERIRRPETIAKMNAAKVKRADERLKSYRSGVNKATNTDWTANTPDVIEDMLEKFMKENEGFTYANIKDKLYFITPDNKITSNWSQLKQAMGKSSAWYYSPLWSLINNHNKLIGTMQKIAHYTEKRYSLEYLRDRAATSAIRGGRRTARRLQKNATYANATFTSLSNRQKAVNTRYAEREALLKGLQGYGGYL